MFQILLSRNQSGAQLPPRAGNHLQRPETGQCAAGFWGSHQAYRLRHVQGVVYGLMWFVMIPQCTLDKSTCTAADVSVYSPLRWSHSWWSFFFFFSSFRRAWDLAIRRALSAVPPITSPPKYSEERITVRITTWRHLPEMLSNSAVRKCVRQNWVYLH